MFAEADSEIVTITRQIDSRTTDNTMLHDMPQESIGSAIDCLFQSDDDLVDTVQTGIEHSMEGIVLVSQDVETLSITVNNMDENVVLMETLEVNEIVTMGTITENRTSSDYNDIDTMLVALQSKSKTPQTWKRYNANIFMTLF